MKLFALVVPFFLSGCIYQSVNSNDIESATQICENRGSKVQEIKASFVGTENVVCTDRSAYSISEYSLKNK